MIIQIIKQKDFFDKTKEIYQIWLDAKTFENVRINLSDIEELSPETQTLLLEMEKACKA